MRSVSLKSVLIPSLAGILLGLYFLGQGFRDSDAPRDLGDLAGLGKDLEPHSHDNDEAKMVLEEALKFKSQPKKEITYRLFKNGGRDWTEKIYRQSLPNGHRFIRQESYLITPMGEQLVETTIINLEGFWKIRYGGLIRLNYRAGPKRMAGIKSKTQTSGIFIYEMERGVEFNGFECVKITRRYIKELKRQLDIEKKKSEDEMPIQKTIFYIEPNNYIVGEENYSEDGSLVSKFKIDDYSLGDIFEDEVFRIDESYIKIEANSIQEYGEISKALAFSI